MNTQTITTVITNFEDLIFGRGNNGQITPSKGIMPDGFNSISEPSPFPLTDLNTISEANIEDLTITL
jgi:hypothetical protein